MANTDTAKFDLRIDEYELHIIREALRAHRNNLRLQREDLLDPTSQLFSRERAELADVEEWLTRTAILAGRVGEKF